MSPTYLIHSAKGTAWTEHKYIKKVNGKYIYANEKVKTSDINDQVSNVMSGKYKGQDLRGALGSSYGLVTKSIASKFKKPGNGSKGSSSNKSSGKSESSSSSKGSSNSSKETSSSSGSTTQTSNIIPDLKTAINGVSTLSDKDSFIATQNDDGSTTVEITYEDGSTQSIYLDNRYKVVKVGEKIKKEETEDKKDDSKLKHSIRNNRYKASYWNPDDGFYNSSIC